MQNIGVYLTIENIKIIENFFEKEIEYFNYIPKL
jgi:hypothetical protein